MPSNNPKDSGYVPQHIYDCFKSFCDEHNLSMSQAIVLILSERFQLDSQVGQGSSFSNPLPEKLAELEEKVALLSSSHGEPSGELLSKVDFLAERILALEERLLVLEQPKVKHSSSQAETLSVHKQLNLIQVEPDSSNVESTDLFPDVSELQGSSSSSSLTVLEPISAKLLSLKRFQKSSSLVSQWKMKNDPEALYKLTKAHDPDSIGWKFVHEPKEGYLPADELSGELLGRLLTWIESNKNF